jgi:membrane fusion protein (multidrug efflux system)
MENKEQTTQNTQAAPAQSGAAVKKKQNTKNKIRAIISNTVVFLVIGFGLFWLVREYFHIGDKTYTEAAQVEEFINPINTRVSAYIKDIKFIEHQKVKKGDTLVILDKNELLTQLGQAEAAYQNAMAQRSATTSSVNTVSNNVSVMESNIAGAKARLWNAEQNLHRYKKPSCRRSSDQTAIRSDQNGIRCTESSI